MSVENPFLEAQTKRRDFQWFRVNTNNLKNYSLKCDRVLFGCDEIKAISVWDGLKFARCFRVPNDTNSKDLPLVIENFSQKVFDSITIIRDNYDSFDKYSVMVVYDGLSPFCLMEFRFYKPHSRIVKQNHYCSDITIHWKCFRISCLENFDILTFLQELLCYELTSDTISYKQILQSLWEYYITRYDFRFDFFHRNDLSCLKFWEVFSPNSRLKKKDDNELVKNRKSWKIYSWWSAWNRKNHYVYVRMYQKKVEILDNNLEDLYNDYVNYDGKIWRLEFEFGSDFTKKARWKHFLVDEFVDKWLEKMAFEYVWIKTPEGWFSCPKSVKPKFKDRSLVSKTRSLSMFWSIWKSLFDSWLNPHFYLDAWLVKNWVPFEDISSLNKPYNIEDLRLLDFKFEDYKKQKKEMYENIFKNQLWFEL